MSALLLLGLAPALVVPACSGDIEPLPYGAAGQGGEGGDKDNEVEGPTCKVGTSGFTVPGALCSTAEEDKECPIAGGDDPCRYGPSLICRNGTWRAETAYLIDCSHVALDENGGAGGAP